MYLYEWVCAHCDVYIILKKKETGKHLMSCVILKKKRENFWCHLESVAAEEPNFWEWRVDGKGDGVKESMAPPALTSVSSLRLYTHTSPSTT